jgi:hypothetical protein
VIAGSQRHGALERVGHGGEVTAVGEPVGEDGHGSAGEDAEQAEQGP